MQEGYQSLTEKEKETLRLLVRGYGTRWAELRISVDA